MNVAVIIVIAALIAFGAVGWVIFREVIRGEGSATVKLIALLAIPLAIVGMAVEDESVQASSNQETPWPLTALLIAALAVLLFSAAYGFWRKYSKRKDDATDTVRNYDKSSRFTFIDWTVIELIELLFYIACGVIASAAFLLKLFR